MADLGRRGLFHRISDLRNTSSALDMFQRSIREIRNALSHGWDRKQMLFIHPTRHNFERLQPWVALICAAAGEVMLYRDTLD